MSKRSQEKRRARSKEKKLAKRRLQGSNPLSRLADVQYCECWMVSSPDDRMISVQVLRPVRGGTTAAAIFLIDRDCIGLKDAFYRVSVDPVAVRDAILERGEDPDTQVTRIDLEEARQAVAEAICWTRQHPFFRMPPETDRCVRILGGAGDIDAADVSGFGKDGKLFYTGRKVDLEPCLLTMDVFEFMARDDVECVFHMGNATFGDIGEGFEEDFDDEYDDEEEEDDDVLMETPAEDFAAPPAASEVKLVMYDMVKHKILDATRRWCFAKAIMPHSDLESVVELVLTSKSMKDLMQDPEVGAIMTPRIQKLLDSLEDPSRKESMEAAGAQFQQFVASYPSPDAFADAMGLSRSDRLSIMEASRKVPHA